LQRHETHVFEAAGHHKPAAAGEVLLEQLLGIHLRRRVGEPKLLIEIAQMLEPQSALFGEDVALTDQLDG
jgi:hypothetical protein